MTETSPQQSASRFALAFIFVTMLVDSIGLGVIIPVAPKIIAQLTHEDMSGAARWGGWLFFVFALMQFCCAPLIGNLSDRFGRRPVLIASILMLGFDYFITGIAPTIFWLFVSRFPLRDRGRELYDGLRLYRRHHAAGETRGEFRHHGGRVQRGIHSWPGAWAVCWANPIRIFRFSSPPDCRC
ncbi:MAG: MFS transporter [Rhizomicrobium sp.]